MDLKQFFDSSPVFYPGSGLDDWQPIRAFGLTRESQAFIQVDYQISEESLRETLSRDGISMLTDEERAEVFMEAWNDDDLVNTRVRAAMRNGPEYTQETLTNVELATIFPKSRVDHMAGVEFNFHDGGPQVAPFALLGTFIRQAPQPSAKSWPEYITILFLGHEATTAYDLLFCQEGQQPPFAVALQAAMHMGFGRNSALASLAARTGVLPEYLQGVAPHNEWEQWEGYVPIEVDTNYPCGRRYRRQDPA